METIYIKLNIGKSDVETEEIRDAGLLFQNISEAIGLDRVSVEEIDESNWAPAVNEIRDKYER